MLTTAYAPASGFSASTSFSQVATFKTSADADTVDLTPDDAWILLDVRMPYAPVHMRMLPSFMVCICLTTYERGMTEWQKECSLKLGLYQEQVHAERPQQSSVKLVPNTDGCNSNKHFISGLVAWVYWVCLITTGVCLNLVLALWVACNHSGPVVFLLAKVCVARLTLASA